MNLLKNVVYTFAKHSPFTNLIALGRALLAFGLLITILFNDPSRIFPEYVSNLNITSDLGENGILDSLNIYNLFEANNIQLANTLVCIILFLVISGFIPQITSVLHAWVQYSYVNKATLIEGGDHLTLNLTLLLIPFCLADLRLNQWETRPFKNVDSLNIIGNFSILSIKIQMAAVYLHSFIAKMSVEEWVNGTILHYWARDSFFGYADYLGVFLDPLVLNEYVSPILTWVILFIELALFGALFASRKHSSIFFSLGFTLHFLIIFIHGLPGFFFAMVGGLILYLRPIKIERLIVGFNSMLKRVFDKFSTD